MEEFRALRQRLAAGDEASAAPLAYLPPFLEVIIEWMVARGIFTKATRPDTCARPATCYTSATAPQALLTPPHHPLTRRCIINFYSEGDCIPPHIDHQDFTRPFVTLSLLSEQSILFGSNIKIVDEGEFAAPFACPLPVGSVLVLDGNGANVAKHCVPSVRHDRVSITFRKIGEKNWKKGFGVNMSAFEGPDGRLPPNARQNLAGGGR